MTSKNWTEKLKPGQPMPNPQQSKELNCNGNYTVWRHFMRLSDCIVVLNDAPFERVSIVVECNIAELKHAFVFDRKKGRLEYFTETFLALSTGSFLISFASCGIL